MITLKLVRGILDMALTIIHSSGLDVNTELTQEFSERIQALSRAILLQEKLPHGTLEDLKEVTKLPDNLVLKKYSRARLLDLEGFLIKIFGYNSVADGIMTEYEKCNA